MHPTWQKLLALQQQELARIEAEVLNIPSLTPKPSLIMRAMDQDPKTVRVLVIGQDPYPAANVACGLAFAISPGTKQPQSLKNLMRELTEDVSEASVKGDLLRWRDQGVMLLNTSLTTEVGSSGAHGKIWEKFIFETICSLNGFLQGRFVTLALGQAAQRLATKCDLKAVVSAPHPSPLSASRGFFGSRVFSRVNAELRKLSLPEVDWSC